MVGTCATLIQAVGYEVCQLGVVLLRSSPCSVLFKCKPQSPDADTGLHAQDLVTDKRGTVDGVAQMLNVDLGTFASLFSVTAILAPLLEETVFRGFLLTTLTKFMPTWVAVLISSFGFGAAHASARDLPQLAALGTLLGFSYVRSRNLLTPMLIHGAWNGTVLVALFTLASSGVDLQVVLSAQQEALNYITSQLWMLQAPL